MIPMHVLILDAILTGIVMFARKNSREGRGAQIAHIARPLDHGGVRDPAAHDVGAQHHRSIEATHRQDVVAHAFNGEGSLQN